MIGHSKNVLNQILWRDAQLLTVNIDYDTVKFGLEESSGLRTTLIAYGYIGIEGIAIWDEMIVESAEVVDKSPILDRFLEALKVNYANELPESGSPDRNLESCHLLTIRLIDGGSFSVGLSRLEIVRQIV